MPVPRISVPRHKPSEKWSKVNRIVCTLTRQGYVCDDARDAIKIIESNHLDKSQFEYPFGSYDVFKTHVLSGDYDFDEESVLMTDEEHEQLQKEVAEGRLWVTY